LYLNNFIESIRFRILTFQCITLVSWLLLPLMSYASFIETTIGTAVVNDATAAYFNPAALVLLKNSQIIPLLTWANFQTQFSGQSKTMATGFMQSGNSSSTTDYFSPSFYLGLPIGNRFILGFSAVSNSANRDLDENSLLRYAQSSNTIQDYDFVPSIGIKINDFFSLGSGVNFSYTSFQLHPITGFPGSNIADSQSNNDSDGSGVGANVGFLLRPTASTLIGFDYRTVTTYRESGQSVFNGTTQLTSNNYHFQLRTPARSIFSISQMLTPKFGMIATIQRFQWSIIRNINVYNFATAIGAKPIITSASIPYYLHNTWLFTLGGNYQFKPNWIIRVAGTYNQSPQNGNYQISTGNSYVLGASLGYQMNKTISLDGGYAHAFIQNQPINIIGNKFLINGVNQAARDVVSLKMTVNV